MFQYEVNNMCLFIHSLIYFTTTIKICIVPQILSSCKELDILWVGLFPTFNHAVSVKPDTGTAEGNSGL